MLNTQITKKLKLCAADILIAFGAASPIGAANTKELTMPKGFELTGKLLAQLSDIGRPRVSRMNDGTWYGSIEFPSPEGVTAKVNSDFNHATPDDALQCCVDRLGGLQNMLSVPTPQVSTLQAIEG